ncbi:hypothetical protein FOJ82_04880 [Tessaracoccus rhinocerotis]|uniref:Outer membrane channel protein CpnT-like N-terminal domain-containing protein n=1 Tax=Tessaracoccus rhinocerotis TaxID=1689449 RepID=A0A553K660_9ACTN|nr:hypothetical protein [Tessaracoccus rhinocerotis]TRY20198.1 hypothetical protein FOJ82_04880 [Tessaracoccus rhinocerotis]
MGMQLPGWLRQALEYVGYDWPATDESVLWDWAQQWNTLAGECTQVISQVQQGAELVTVANQGPAARAFAQHFGGEDTNLKAIVDFRQGAVNVAGAHGVAAGIVLTMKLAVIAQLVILAAAIASAVATLGLASGAALAARQAAKWAIEAAINIAVEQILAA